MGAGCGVSDFAAERRQVKANHAEKKQAEALDQLVAQVYGVGATRRAGGVWRLRPPFRFKVDELLSPAERR